MHDCDLMVAVGSRFDDRVTGRLNAFAPNSKKIHIDIDPSSINKNVRIDVPLLRDCGEVVGALLATCRKSAGQQDKAALKGVARDRWLARSRLPAL